MDIGTIIIGRVYVLFHRFVGLRLITGMESRSCVQGRDAADISIVIIFGVNIFFHKKILLIDSTEAESLTLTHCGIVAGRI